MTLPWSIPTIATFVLNGTILLTHELYAPIAPDMSALDHFTFDVAIPEMADYMAVPSRWMSSLDDIKAKREARTQQAETQQMIDAAPAAASVAKTMQGGAAQ